MLAIDSENYWNLLLFIGERQIEKLIEALKPFAAYAELSGSKYVPDDFQISQGSKFAARQLTMGDCRKASQVLKDLQS